MALTVTLYGAHSTASARVSPATADLLATYAATSNRPTNDDSEAMVMMRPDRLRHHLASEHLATAQRAGEVGVDDPLPVVIGHLERRHALGDARGAHQDVDAAERLEHRVAHALERGRRRSTSAGSRSVRRPRASISAATASTSAARRPTLTTSAPASARPSASVAADAAGAADDDGRAAGEIEQRHQ